MAFLLQKDEKGAERYGTFFLSRGRSDDGPYRGNHGNQIREAAIRSMDSLGKGERDCVDVSVKERGTWEKR